jgi:hypothetical protein
MSLLVGILTSTAQQLGTQNGYFTVRRVSQNLSEGCREICQNGVAKFVRRVSRIFQNGVAKFVRRVSRNLSEGCREICQKCVAKPCQKGVAECSCTSSRFPAS